MARCVWPHAALAVLLLVLAGCSQPFQQAQRPAWRAQAEKACFAEGKVKFSRYVALKGREMDGPGICGMTQPIMVGALAEDQVQLDTVATLDCPMVAALNAWIAEVVQPVAQARFGQPVTQIDTMGSYSCRGMNGGSSSRISEHAFGNALDIGGFRLADGRRVSVVRGWTRGDDQEQAFLRDVHAGACNSFTTVLGPGSNVFHYNHIHVDLAMHGNSSRGLRRICKPVPEASRPGPRRDDLPDAPAVEEDMDVAGAQEPSAGRAERGLVADAPPAYVSSPRRAAAYEATPGRRSPAEDEGPRQLGSQDDDTPRKAATYSRAPARGSFRDDGAFEPEGNPSEWDVTSSIKRR